MLAIAFTFGLVLLIFGISTALYFDWRENMGKAYDLGNDRDNNEDKPQQLTWAAILDWLSQQKQYAKLAWTIIAGVALYLGYDVTATVTNVNTSPVTKDGDTVIVIEGEVLSISGYRVTKLEKEDGSVGISETSEANVGVPRPADY